MYSLFSYLYMYNYQHMFTTLISNKKILKFWNVRIKYFKIKYLIVSASCKYAALCR